MLLHNSQHCRHGPRRKSDLLIFAAPPHATWRLHSQKQTKKISFYLYFYFIRQRDLIYTRFQQALCVHIHICISTALLLSSSFGWLTRWLSVSLQRSSSSRSLRRKQKSAHTGTQLCTITVIIMRRAYESKDIRLSLTSRLLRWVWDEAEFEAVATCVRVSVSSTVGGWLVGWEVGFGFGL